MKKSILIGKQGNDKVILEIELKNKPCNHPSITTMLTPVLGDSYKTLSISGSIGNHSFGQIYDNITPNQLDELYVDRDWLIDLLAIWEVGHLNDLNAGTELQMEYIQFFKDQFLQSKDYVDHDVIRSMLKQHHLLIDNETNPNLSVGYKYGSAWLVRWLPDSINDFFDSLTPSDPTTIRSNTFDYLLEHKFKWTIKLTDSNPFMQSQSPMDHWKVTLINSNGNKFNTYFSTGFGFRLTPNTRFPSNAKLHSMLGNWMRKTIRMLGIKPNGNIRTQMTKLGFQIPIVSHYNRSDKPFNGLPIPPMPDQVIESIVSDYLSIENYNSWDDWAYEMGYNLESKEDRLKAKTIYNQVQLQSDKAQMFFREHWRELIERSY
jgi:hypothetical protein